MSDIYKRVLQTLSKSSFELRKRAMNRIEFYEDGKITFTYITKKDEEEAGSTNNDHDGIVEIGRDIEGVEISIFLHGIADKPNGFKVSLRSKDYVNVSDICIMFGGGGHPRAAGAFITGTIEQIKEKLLVEARKQLK